MTRPFPSSVTMRDAVTVRSAALTLAVFAAGCGGEDKGRVSGNVDIVQARDQCEFASQFELGTTIVDFDPYVENGIPKLGAHCDDPVCVTNPFYFNHDYYTVTRPDRDPSCRATDYEHPEDKDEPSSCTFCPSHEVATSEPTLGGSDFVGKPIPEKSRCGKSENALHFTATNIGTCFGANGRRGWGGSIEIKLNQLDVSKYDGVSFWVKKGSGRTQPSFLLSLVDNDTVGIDTGVKGQDHCGCLPISSVEDTPQCSADPDKTFANFPDGLKCDPFGAAITLSDEWSFVPVYFANVHQKGFGKAAPLGHVDQSALARLQFLVGPGDWDFWLDNITLFRGPR